MKKYTFITYLLDIDSSITTSEQAEDIMDNYDNNYYNHSYYDIITINFIGDQINNYNLEPFGSKIKSSELYRIENRYIGYYDSDKCYLIKFDDGKFGYLKNIKHDSKIYEYEFSPFEFESQDIIKNKLLDFYLDYCSA
jgi:hypothetical protein